MRELAVAAVVAAAVAACRCRRAVVVAFVAVVPPLSLSSPLSPLSLGTLFFRISPIHGNTR